MKSLFLGKLVNANNINDLVRISNQKTWKSLESNSRVRDFQAYMNLINSRIRNEENKKYFFFY
jgi:hypothetical protein